MAGITIIFRILVRYFFKRYTFFIHFSTNCFVQRMNSFNFFKNVIVVVNVIFLMNISVMVIKLILITKFDITNGTFKNVIVVVIVIFLMIICIARILGTWSLVIFIDTSIINLFFEDVNSFFLVTFILVFV